jgi:predicted Zn-dependent protease
MKTIPRLIILAALLASVTASAQFPSIPGLNKKDVDTGMDAMKLLKGASGVSAEAEADIGDSVALQVVTKFGGLVRDDEIMRRVNLVGRALARYSARPHLNWRFAVLNSDTVNAFSAPDGYVFITRGLYALAPDDDRLAGILGHEIAHITERHALKIVGRTDLISGAAGIAGRQSSDVNKFNQYAGAVGLSAEKVLNAILDKGYDPNSEYTSDKVGHDLAETVGFAPGGLRAVLTDLKAKGDNRKVMFSTHPPLAERLKRLPNDPAPEPPAADGKDQPAGEAK